MVSNHAVSSHQITGLGKGQRSTEGPVVCSSLVFEPHILLSRKGRAGRWKAANDAILIHISQDYGVQILRCCLYLFNLHLVCSLLELVRSSDNLRIKLLFSCFLSLFSNKLRQFMSLTKSIFSRHHLDWTQNAASNHEKRKAESSLWWLSGEFSFSGARKLRNSNNMKKLCRAWRFPSANSWQIFPKGNPCPLKSSSKYLQYYLATHCYKKIKSCF